MRPTTPRSYGASQPTETPRGWRTRSDRRYGRHHGAHVVSVHLSPHEQRALAEVLVHGDQREAARCLGISYEYLKQTLHFLRQRVGAVSTFDLPVRLGWVTLPEGTGHEELHRYAAVADRGRGLSL